MKKLFVCDMTLSQVSGSHGLTFKERIEIAKLLDKLKLSVIELAPVEDVKADTVLVKTIATCVKNSILAIPAAMTETGCADAWNAVKNAVHPRIQISFPMSTVQMEYVCHKKPAQVLEMISEAVKNAKTFCEDVEFVASDATRSESEFLKEAIERAIEAGAGTVTICDTAGEMIPDEFIAFLDKVYEAVPKLKDVRVAISASNELGMATATVLSAIRYGVDEIKTACCKTNTVSLESVMKIIRARGNTIGVESDVSVTEFQRSSKQICRICSGMGISAGAAGDSDESDSSSLTLNAFTDMDTVSKVVASLGYDLSSEDMARVYDEFKRTAEKKDINTRELEAIVASSAMQVPAAYKVVSYVINSGNVISSTANITLEKDEKTLSGVSIGDGPIDAAFLAIEQIIGHHYELDDFQIQSVTEGREAIGSALVKLRADGKVYSGNGVSTDIIGASIRAYVNALNKIVYEQTV